MLLNKYKFLKTSNPSTSEQVDEVETVIEVQEEEEEVYDDPIEEESMLCKDVEYEELIEVSED